MTLGATSVLLVEDHPIVRAGVLSALSTAEDLAVVGEAETGAGALRLAATRSPDVVLLDISLPDGSGIDLVGDLRTAGCGAVVMFSCHREERYIRAAMEAGASGYLVKSAAPHELVDAVRQAKRGETPMCAEAATCLVKAFRRERRPMRPELTAREREVWRLVATGAANQEIARTLFISDHTVKFHIHNLLRKLGLKSRAEAIRAAHRCGLIA
ncbi:MAG TPA: response regulator transcription factor [Coriobacteriia bacterium]